MHEHDNLEKLAGYGLIYARWTAFQIIFLAGLSVLSVVIFFVVIWVLLMSELEHPRIHNIDQEVYHKLPDKTRWLSKEDCIQQGYKWSTIHFTKDSRDYVWYRCTEE